MGNNYCQDNDTSWVDWSLAERHQELVRFTRQILGFRRTHAVLRREAFYTDRDVQWFAPAGRAPDWLDPNQRRLACLIRGHEGPDLYLMFNADMTLASFVLPELRAGVWKLAIDTSQPSEDADSSARDGCEVKGALYALGSRSSAILVATE